MATRVKGMEAQLPPRREPAGAAGGAAWLAAANGPLCWNVLHRPYRRRAAAPADAVLSQHFPFSQNRIGMPARQPAPPGLRVAAASAGHFFGRGRAPHSLAAGLFGWCVLPSRRAALKRAGETLPLSVRGCCSALSLGVVTVSSAPPQPRWRRSPALGYLICSVQRRFTAHAFIFLFHRPPCHRTSMAFVFSWRRERSYASACLRLSRAGTK